MFASIMMRCRRSCPGSVYIILSSDELNFVFTHRGISIIFVQQTFIGKKKAACSESKLPL